MSPFWGEEEGEKGRGLGIKPCEMPMGKGAEEVGPMQASDRKLPGTQESESELRHHEERAETTSIKHDDEQNSTCTN